MRNWGVRIALFALMLPFAVGDATARKLKKEELIALHLKSIGENAVRKNRVAQGTGTMDIRVGGQGNLNGRAMLLSEGDKLRTALIFNHVQYPKETLIRNGDQLDIAYITTGVRSQLGTVLWENFPRLVQEGLYAGVLSTDWALLKLKDKRARIRYRGLKTFEGRKLHEVDYKPREKGPLPGPALLRAGDLPPRGQQVSDRGSPQRHAGADQHFQRRRGPGGLRRGNYSWKPHRIRQSTQPAGADRRPGIRG